MVHDVNACKYAIHEFLDPWSTWWWVSLGYIYRSYDDLRRISLGMLMPQIRPNRFEFEAWNTDGVVLQAGDFSEGCPIFMGFPGSWLVSPWLTKKDPPGCSFGLFFGGGWDELLPSYVGIMNCKAWHYRIPGFFLVSGRGPVTTLEPPQPRPKRMIWW